jgi:molecular chaperone DnaK (HSP70)
MDQERARDLLANLLERAKTSQDKVFLTSREIDALAAVLDEKTPFVAAHDLAEVSAPLGPIPIVRLVQVQIAPEQIDPNSTLCVDFGTSFSKAFASIRHDGGLPELVDLPLGDGSTGTRLTTPSELFIDDDLICFGADARRRWDDIQAPTERLVDSIKQFITLNKDVSALGERAMPVAQDPQQRFSQRDILVLYLAHLTSLTERALQQKNIPIDIKRRFTHPAWKDGAKEQNEREMRRLMAEAVLLSRSADFLASLRISSARQLLDQLSSLELEALPVALIGEPVREATAAGAGALLGTRDGAREAYLVLDIGAGTTDVAGFYCVNNPNNDRMRVFEVSAAADAKNMAGNTLDNALQRFIFDRSGLALDSAESRIAGHVLRRSLRAYKEELFRTSKVIVALTTDQIVEIQLSDFLAYEPVVQFSKHITEMAARAAVTLAGDLNKVNLVATGGGARLPIVRELGENGIRLGEKSVRFNVVDAMPSDIREVHPDLIDPYPQIAVALGGALPDLPEQRAGVTTGIVAAPKITLGPMYKS